MRFSRWVWRSLLMLPALVLAGLLASQTYINASQDDAKRLTDELIVGEARQHAEVTLRRQAQYARTYLMAEQQAVTNALKQRLAEEVDGATAILDNIYAQSQPLLSPDALQALMRESLRNVRFLDGRGYFFIDGMDGKVILMPLHPKNEGITLLENRDDQGTFIMRGLIQAAQQPGGAGFFNYRWYAPDSKDKMIEKIAYVRHFAPYDWLIGAGDYVPAMESSVIRRSSPQLASMRFGASGAIGLANLAGDMVLFPETSITPNSGRALQRDDINTLKAKILSTAQAGGGLISFQWPDFQSGRTGTRLAWVESVTDGSVSWAVYASAHLNDFLPATPPPLPASFFTPARTYALAVILALAAILLAWLFPVRHGS